MLSAAQLQGLRLKLVGQLHNLIVDVGLLGGFHHLVVRGAGIAILDVFLDGTVEDMILLENQTDVLTQPMGIPFLQFHAIQLDATAIGVVELVEQIDDSGLSGSAQPHQCRNLSRQDVHTHIGQCLRAVAIGEIHTAQLELALHRLGMILTGILHLVMGVQDAEKALGINQGVVHVVVDAMQLADGSADITEQHDMIHYLTNTHTRIVD